MHFVNTLHPFLIKFLIVFIVNKMDSQAQFIKKLKELLSKKKDNSRVMSTIEYETLVDLLTSEPEIKSSKYYYYKKNFTTIIIENVTKIAKVFPTGEVKIVLPTEKIFSIIDEAHKNIGHGGERKNSLKLIGNM